MSLIRRLLKNLQGFFASFEPQPVIILAEESESAPVGSEAVAPELAVGKPASAKKPRAVRATKKPATKKIAAKKTVAAKKPAASVARARGRALARHEKNPIIQPHPARRPHRDSDGRIDMSARRHTDGIHHRCNHGAECQSDLQSGGRHREAAQDD